MILEWIIYGLDSRANAYLAKIDPKKDYINSNDQMKFIIAPEILGPGYYYIEFKMYTKDWNKVKLYSKTN